LCRLEVEESFGWRFSGPGSEVGRKLAGFGRAFDGVGRRRLKRSALGEAAAEGIGGDGLQQFSRPALGRV